MTFRPLVRSLISYPIYLQADTEEETGATAEEVTTIVAAVEGTRDLMARVPCVSGSFHERAT